MIYYKPPTPGSLSLSLSFAYIHSCLVGTISIAFSLIGAERRCTNSKDAETRSGNSSLACPTVCALRQDTGEAHWEAPGVPFRPMVRDRMSGSLIQAWPQLERELLEVRCYMFRVLPLH